MLPHSGCMLEGKGHFSWGWGIFRHAMNFSSEAGEILGNKDLCGLEKEEYVATLE